MGPRDRMRRGPMVGWWLAGHLPSPEISPRIVSLGLRHMIDAARNSEKAPDSCVDAIAGTMVGVPLSR